MGKESVDVLIEGGKATAAPPLGPALGPLGVNIGQVVADINKKTESFKGMQVPVKVTVDSDTKEYDISIGTPPASALIKKEAGVQKGAGNPKTEKVADLSIVQLNKIATMKEDNLLGKDLKQRVKEIAGTCQSMGIMIEGLSAADAIKEINAGKFDDIINSGKTELTAEERAKLDEEKKKLQEELKVNKEKYVAQAKSIIAAMPNKSPKDIRAKMVDAGIPSPVINEIAPAEEAKKKK